MLVKKEKDVKQFNFMAEAPDDTNYYSTNDKDVSLMKINFCLFYLGKELSYQVVDISVMNISCPGNLVESFGG